MNVERTRERESGRIRGLRLALFAAGCLAGAGGGAAAQEVRLPDLETRTRAVRNMCMAIGDQMDAIPSRDPPGHREAGTTFHYLYEQMVFAGAGIEPGVAPEERNRRIRALFAEKLPGFYCNNNFFDISGGHVAKYAVANKFDDFIYDLIAWGVVELNLVDEADGETLLDYVEFHLNKSRGGALEPILRNYYDRLRAAGALHAREL